MNWRAVILFGFMISTLCSCDDSVAIHADEFKVVVESTADLACSLPLIRFTGSLGKIKSKTSNDSLLYNAYHLADSLNVMGAVLIVQIHDVHPSDYKVCNMFGLGYPAIAIIRARRIE